MGGRGGISQAFNWYACNRIYITIHNPSTYTIKCTAVIDFFSEFFGSRLTKAVVPKFYLYCKILDCKVDKSRASSLGLLQGGKFVGLSKKFSIQIQDRAEDRL